MALASVGTEKGAGLGKEEGVGLRRERVWGGGCTGCPAKGFSERDQGMIEALGEGPVL